MKKIILFIFLLVGFQAKVTLAEVIKLDPLATVLVRVLAQGLINANNPVPVAVPTPTLPTPGVAATPAVTNTTAPAEANLQALPKSENQPVAGAANQAKQAQIQQAIQKINPDLLITEVSPSPLPGINQVIANNEIFYVTEDHKYLLHGDLLDLTQPKATINQTETVRKQLRRQAIDQSLLKEMLIFKPSTPSKSVVTIFTDVDCVFCQRLHQEIKQVNEAGIEVRYLAFPRQGIGSSSYNKIANIWCHADPQGTFTLAINGNAVATTAGCELPVANHYNLGRKLNIQGTPTIIFADGTMLAGYLAADQLINLALEHQLPKTSELGQ
jgi:thiol:disulfide interchange protein DsbC